jgi:hypothetical protein
MIRACASRCLLAAALMILLPAVCPAQYRMRRDQKPLLVDGATTKAVIDEALKRLDADYVFPEMAKKMADAIRAHEAANAYAQVSTGQQLAERLTRDLQAVSKDKHLRVICSTEKLPEPHHSPEGTPQPGAIEEEMLRFGGWLNGGYRTVERLGGNVGYVALDGFLPVDVAAEPAAAAMNFLANTDALIIDLRNNGGGDPRSVALLCSYFFGSAPVHINSIYSRKENKTEDFYTLKEVAGKRYGNKDVYVLTSPRTFSGAEEFAYDMQTQKRAVLVGTTTGGGAHPGETERLDDHFLMFVPSGRPINPITKTDWEGTGVKPDVAVPVDEALEKAHDLAVQKLLKNAKDAKARERIEADLEHSHKLKTRPVSAEIR